MQGNAPHRPPERQSEGIRPRRANQSFPTRSTPCRRKFLLAFAEHGEVEGDKVTGRAPEARQVHDALSGQTFPTRKSSPPWRLTASRSSYLAGRTGPHRQLIAR